MRTGLVYVADTDPGLKRLSGKAGFRYVSADGKPVRDRATLERIRALAIAPAYADVWICPRADGHLQATGRDARGRKQYLYHPAWRAFRDAEKFDRMQAFGQALPKLRSRVSRDLNARAAPQTRIVAALVRLLDATRMRVGNDQYVRDNGSFGLTTLRRRHATVQGDTVRLRFRGKSGVLHDVALDEPRVARVVRRCQSLPGQELFRWVDGEGTVHSVGSAEVNAYLQAVTGQDFTAKDFRTWHATVHALDLLLACDTAGSPAQAQRLVNDALRSVAARLGNTLAVCRKSYVHPEVVARFMQGGLAAQRSSQAVPRGTSRLPAAEQRLVAFLRGLQPAAKPTAPRRAAGSARRATAAPAAAA